MSELVIFTYSSKGLSKKDKVRFYYALKGRNSNEGILKRTNTKFLAKGALLSPISSKDEIEEFFSVWKIPFKEIVVKEVNNETS